MVYDSVPSMKYLNFGILLILG